MTLGLREEGDSSSPAVAEPKRRLPLAESFEDWRWQLRNRISTKEEIAARLPLTPEESAGLDAAPGPFRVAVTPYYFSLINPDDRNDPIRRQSVPSPLEAENPSGYELEDPLEEDKDSPVLAQEDIWLTNDAKPMMPEGYGFQLFTDRAPLRVVQVSGNLVAEQSFKQQPDAHPHGDARPPLAEQVVGCRQQLSCLRRCGVSFRFAHEKESGLSPARLLGILVCAEKMERHVKVIADDPAIVSNCRHVEDCARP